jgi:hypothetical protein
MLPTSILAALLCLGATACSDSPAMASDECRDGAPAGVGGEFEVTLSGSETLELCGFATSSEGPEGVGWSVHLLTPGGGNSLLLVTAQTGRPVPNTYDVVDFVATDATPMAEDYVVLIALEDDVLGATGLSSVTGTLTITSSSASQVSGTFEFSARESTVGAAVVTITGTFTAANEDA